MSSIIIAAIESIIFASVGIVGINLITSSIINNAIVSAIVVNVVPVIIAVATLILFLKLSDLDIDLVYLEK